jgi:hypothetical protein
MPETKGKYEGVDEPLKISSLYVWNKYNEGFDLALQECRPYITTLTLRVDKLKKENEELKQGICEHAKRDELTSGCKLCELAVAEKGYPLWKKRAEKAEKELGELKAIKGGK